MSGFLRQWWRRTSVSPRLLAFTRWRIAVEWRVRGKSLPPPHIVKQAILLRYQRARRFRTFVETGTYTGEMLAAMRPYFADLISIELAPAIYTATSRRFAGDPAVHLLLGDSGELLPQVLRTLDHPALFWLDGHYMGAGTGRTQVDSPIDDEMSALLRHPVRGHLVLIDDARLFTGRDGYPTVAALRARVERERPGSLVELDADIIRCAFDARDAVS
jgi:hypothetical protein